MYMPRKARPKSGSLNEVEASLEKQWNNKFDIKNEFPLSNIHKQFLESVLNPGTNMCIVNGPAGSSKTYIATLAALLLLRKSQVDDLVYIRSVVESATNKLGYLPGDLHEKFHPWSMPLMDKLHELLSPTDVHHIMKSGSINCVPVNLVRGLTFKNSIVIVDECQNMTKSELITVLTRFGIGSRYVLLGDSRQSDIGYKTGFMDVHRAFDTEKSKGMGIHTFTFTNNEIVRHPLLAYICEVVEGISPTG
jgi:phosphate starvation-inducible PhoH-like protein